MSKSYKLAIFKDKAIKSIYWRIIRRVSKFYLKQNKDIPSPKEIINDYDYSDYTIDYEFNRFVNYFWYNGKKYFDRSKYKRK